MQVGQLAELFVCAVADGDYQVAVSPDMVDAPRPGPSQRQAAASGCRDRPGSIRAAGWVPEPAGREHSRDQADAHLGVLGAFAALDNPTLSTLTQEPPGWRPVHPH